MDYNALDMTQMDKYQTGEVFDPQDAKIDGGSIAPGSTATVHVAWCSKYGPPSQDRTPFLFVDTRSVTLGWQWGEAAPTVVTDNMENVAKEFQELQGMIGEVKPIMLDPPLM
jgi:hypothetical protein